MTSPHPAAGATVAVMGAGSWGTTFAAVLADAGCSVSMWGRREEVCREITERRANSQYLPEIVLPQGIRATTDAAAAVRGAGIVVLAVPSQSLREHLDAWRPLIGSDAVLVSLMKGVELGSRLRMSELVHQVAAVSPARVAVVSGPNLAREIAVRQPTAAVVACPDLRAAETVAAACSTPYFRPYTTTDVVGAELGGAVKNVIALSVGMAEGLGMGDNTKATIITRGLAETIRLGVAMGADPATFSGLAGLGDLVATCASPLSRNRSAGVQLGRGSSVADVVGGTRQTAEGIKSCRSILDLAHDHAVEMPITEAVVAVVHGGLGVAEMGDRLLSRARRPEQD